MSVAANCNQRLLSVAIGVLLWLTVAEADAASGNEFTLPSGPKFPSGLTLHIDARGIDANGYRPFKVTVATVPSGKVLTADRQVRVVLSFYRNGSQRKAQVSQVIELPEGSSTVTATMLVPQMGSWHRMDVETYEGGQKLRDLSEEQLPWQNPFGWNWTEASPALLFIDSKVPAPEDHSAALQAFATTGSDASPTHTLPDVRVVLGLFPELNNTRVTPGNPPTNASPYQTSPTISDTALLWMLALRSRTHMVSPQKLPERWIELSQYDVAVISLMDLTDLARRQPKQFAALRDWASTGPLLIVYGAGEQFSHLAQLETLLELTPLKPHPELPDLRGWLLPNPLHKNASVTKYLDESGIADPPPVNAEPDVTADNLQNAASAQINEAKSSPPPFLFRPAALGCLAAISSDNPFPGQRQDWNWLFAATGWNHWQWFRRTGFSLHRTNIDYWKLLIPGVGQAPVYSFLFLVSLFAVVIGPVNFYLLGRARRLYLLLLTVPAGAVIVTLGLFGFALVSDGLGMRLRVRSYADLDQKTGRAAVWSRQSYYAGIAPSRGLRFPDDTIVFPIAHEPGSSANDKTTLLVWDDDQLLRNGYLSSRTATQLIACRATSTSATLAVTEGASAVLPPRVENKLGARIHYLLLCDSHGNHYSASSVHNNGKAELKPTDLLTAKEATKRLTDAAEPKEPDGFSADFRNDNILSIFGVRRYRFGTNDNVAGDPQMSSSLLEGNVKSATALSILPPPRMYIAILDRSPLVVTGVGPVNEEASFHVIRGRY